MIFWRRLNLEITFYLVLWWASSALVGAPLCPQLRELTRRLEPIDLTLSEYDSAVELELTMTPTLMRFLTTTTGTLAPLNLSSAPKSLTDWAASSHPGRDLASIAWEPLPYKIKLEVMAAHSAASGHNFFDSRKMSGFRYADEVEIRVTERTSLFGTTYNPGVHRLKTSEFLHGEPEYKSPGAVSNPKKGIEIHVRRRQNPGQLSGESRKFQRLAGIDVTHQHVHVVTKFPVQWLRTNPVVNGKRLVYFTARVNRLAEMVRILEGSSGLRKKVHAYPVD